MQAQDNYNVPYKLREFIFLEFSNGIYNDQLIRKFQVDEGFRKFVLV